jgi:uncharacterized peroxidase-related enzyme
MVARQDERELRAKEAPIVGGLGNVPGIQTAFAISARLAQPMRCLADFLLVEPFPGATISRAERELIATAVSSGNDCFYCMDSHGTFASLLLQTEAMPAERADYLVDKLKDGSLQGFGEKVQELIAIARRVGGRARDLTQGEVRRATDCGASDQDVQLAVLIAAAFSMYNRIVDGFRATTPSDVLTYRQRGQHIVDRGYSNP